MTIGMSPVAVAPVGNREGGHGWARPVGPWFRDRPRLAAAVAGLLYVSTWAAGLLWVDVRDAAAVVFVLPVALFAVTFGRRGGIGGGLAALGALLLWELSPGRTVDLAMWAGVLAIALVGGLLGEAVDGLLASERRIRAADAALLQAEQTAQQVRAAAEVNDMIVQSAAAAKWALELGNIDRATEVLDEAVGNGQRIVSALLRAANPCNDNADWDSENGDPRSQGVCW